MTHESRPLTFCGVPIRWAADLSKEYPVDKIEVEENGGRFDPIKPQFWWRWKTRNGKIFATSETYTRVGTARRMAAKAAAKIGAKLVDKTK